MKHLKNIVSLGKPADHLYKLAKTYGVNIITLDELIELGKFETLKPPRDNLLIAL